MNEPPPSAPRQDDEALRAEIVRLNKIVQALMNRAESSSVSARGSDFSLFQTAVVLEEQVRRRTADLEAALRENEKINRALQHATAQMEREIQERRRAQEALHQSEERYRAATEAALDAFITTDDSYVITFVNPAAEKIFGYGAGELIGRQLTSLMPPRLRHKHVQAMRKYLTAGKKQLALQGVQLPCLHKTGREIPLEFSFGEFFQDGKRFFTGIARDITERKRADALRDGQRRVLEMIARDAPLAAALTSLLRCIESQCEGMLGCVLLLADDGQHVHSAVSPSLPSAYLEALQGVRIGPDMGSCGTAMYRREPVIVADISQDPLWTDCRAMAEPYGLRACWSRPIFSGGGNVLGAFAMYYREVRSPCTAELQLLELAVGIAAIAIERRQHEAYIQHMAHHDALTGLPNRTLLEDRLRQAIAQAHRHGTRVAVLFIDLDHFKHINDSLGHHVGDRVLQSVARRMQQCVREGDSVARLGGDEFVICLSSVSHNRDASAVAQKIQEALAQPIAIDGHGLQVGSSIGISLYPLDGQEATALMKAADAAMYDAKGKGRGNYQFFTPELNVAAQQRLAVSNQLRRALPRGELLVHYQPQLSMKSGAIVGVEALLRWRHPELHLVPPARFIPILEEIGLMAEIGKWVLRTACLQNLEWQAQGLPPIRMAVNLSARQFSGGAIVATVAEVLHETGLDAQWLDLEITESLILDNSEPVIKAMHDLKDMGVSLSLDDFGTGYSSLSYLRRFPVDRLKIDRSFVHDIACDAGAADIVRSILALSQKLGLAVIAEGVETEVQLGYLQKQGCPEIQGFLFSPALAAPEMTALLRSDRRLHMALPVPPAEHTLLVVDDDRAVGVTLKRLLRKEGLNVLTALDADEAFDVLAKNDVGVIIADLRMPGKNGIELLCRAKSLYPDTIRILLTAYAEIGSVVNAINKGAIYKILTKPWEDKVLIDNIREAFTLYCALQENMGVSKLR